MAMTSDTIKNAIINAQTNKLSTEDAALELANAIINTVKELTLSYTTGLIAPSGGGPVTGNLSSVVIS